MNLPQSRTRTLGILAGGAMMLLALGIAGGFLLARSGGGDDGDSAAALPSPGSPEPKTGSTVTPTPSAPAPTPVPPTPTPGITTPKYHDIFRAEGGTASQNKTTALPARNLGATWDNSYRACPGTDCVRGRANVWTTIGPGGAGESLEATASVFNTFSASRANANLLMDLKWAGTLASIVGANSNTGVEIEILVSELDVRGMPVKAVPGMPFSVISRELGLDAVSGADRVTVEGTRQVNIPLTLSPGKTYRVELSITCTARALISASTTSCLFSGEGQGVEWTRQTIEFDQGICPANDRTVGCVNANN